MRPLISEQSYMTHALCMIGMIWLNLIQRLALGLMVGLNTAEIAGQYSIVLKSPYYPECGDLPERQTAF
jgi:hypothetical protein